MALDKIEIAPSITLQERQSRLERLRQNMAEAGSDCILLTPGSNLRYITGLVWGQSERLLCALVTMKELVFVCPKFEDTAVKARMEMPIDDFLFWDEHENPYHLVSVYLKKLNCKQLELDTNCNFHHAILLQGEIEGMAVKSTHTSLSPMRSCKTPTELALMISAKQATLTIHKHISTWIRTGMRTSEVKYEIDRLHREMGADNGSTFCIVQYGEATSHPHGVPGDPKLKSGELILIDTGCALDGYNSDITRTYALDDVSTDVERIWDIEKEAQTAAFDMAAPGVLCEALDTAARQVLQKHDLGPDYVLPGLPHRLGHGIGLDVHEGPYLVRGDQTVLAEGMCFSNEPMIVVPNQFGVRLEDHLYITKTGASWFTEPQHSLYKPFG